MSLTSCQTQYIEFSYALSPNGHGFGKLPGPMPVGLATWRAQVDMSLAIIIGPILGHKTLIVYLFL